MSRLKSNFTWIGIVVLSVCFGAGGYLWWKKAATAARPGSSHSDLLVGDAVTLVPGIHLLAAHRPSASYLVEPSEWFVLIYSCTHADASPILQQVAPLQLDVSRLRAILLTHAHADHRLGASRLREL